MHVQLGPILDKRYKDTKNLTATFEELGAKAGKKASATHSSQHLLKCGQTT